MVNLCHGIPNDLNATCVNAPISSREVDEDAALLFSQLISFKR